MSALNICNGAIGAGFASCYPRNRVKSATFLPSSATNSPRKRCLRQSLRFRYMAEMLARHCSQPLSFSPHCMESSKTTLVLMDNGDVSEDRLHNDISFPHTGPSGTPKENEVLLSDICSGFKFTVLMGLLFFQGSQAANAGTELAAVQPLSFIGDLGDISTGFASAFLLIFFSELGDKTFFIAALLAARNSGAIVFLGTFGALSLDLVRISGTEITVIIRAMSVVSVVLGRAFHYVDGIVPFRLGDADFPVDDFAAVCLLVYFGVTTLLEAASGEDQKIKEEQEEAKLAISDFSGDGAGIMAAASTALSTFLLVFVAEWGDKSFFSTIALAAASSPLGVIGGALAGHALATLLAVVGGSLLGTFLSEKVIAYVGGSLFLVFAAVTLVEIVN